MGNSARQKLRKLAAELDEMEKEMKKIDAEQADVARQLSVLKKSSIGYSSRLKDISSRTKNYRIEGFDGRKTN